jgi:hypothetical protein
MEAKLMKKSGGMNHIKKTGGMQHMKKTGGMQHMKKIGGMNHTKKVGGKCGMTIHNKGGMYHKTKGGTLKKLLKGGDDGVLAMNGVKYQVEMKGDSVTVTKLVDDEIPPAAEPAAEEEVTEPVTEDTQKVDALLEDLGEDGKGPLRDSDLNTEEKGDEEDEEDEEDEGEDPFADVGDSKAAAEELLEENKGVWNDDMQTMLDELNDKEEKTDDDEDAIKLLEDQKEGFELDGGKHHKKKKGGKTLKKGGKHHKKHAGSVKKAFNKLFKRGGNKHLAKKGGKK